MPADEPGSHRTRKPEVLSLRTLGFIVLALAVFFATLASLSFVTGKAHPQESVYRVLGAGLLAGVIAVLATTARIWAQWFSPLCFLAALKALFAALVALTFRFIAKPPRSGLDVPALIAAVIAVCWNMLTPAPNLWPTRTAVALLGIAWLGHWVPSAISHHKKLKSGDLRKPIS